MNYPKEILDHLPVMATMIDMQSHEVLYANRQMKEIFGDVVGETCWQVLQKDQHGPCPFCSNTLLVDENGLSSGTCRQQVKNTLTQRWYDVTDSASVTEDGRLVKMTIATDITEQLNPVRSPAPDRPRCTPENSQKQKMVVMCARCSRIRDAENRWLSPAQYIKKEMGLLVSHGMCSRCATLLYPGLLDDE